MSDPAILDGGSWYYRVPEVLERDIGEEVVVAAPRQQGRRRLVAHGGGRWRLLETPQMFVTLVKLLAREYERLLESFAVDVGRVLQELIHRGLVANVADGDD